MKTLVYQSYRRENVPPWIGGCLESVRTWAREQGFAYQLLGDEIAESLPPWALGKITGDESSRRWPMVADLARLYLARTYLKAEFDRVIWLDADVLVFDPRGLDISVRSEFAFGRENWIQPGPNGGLKIYRNVHNAICVFCRNNSFLDFYIHACLSILERSDGPLPPQALGPKLLTSLHNTVGFQVVDSVGALSPLVLSDINDGEGRALERLRETSSNPVSAVNLCASLAGRTTDGVKVDATLLETVVERMKKDPTILRSSLPDRLSN